MNYTKFLTEEEAKVTARARYVYGDTAQILVSNEELCELAAVCAKYPRYTDSERAVRGLYSKALDEVADVFIVLDHIVHIMGLTDSDIKSRIASKVERLDRWLQKTESQDITLEDRKVTFTDTEHCSCVGCDHYGDFKSLRAGGACISCVDGSNRKSSTQGE